MRFHAAAEGKLLNEGLLGRSASSSGEEGDFCFSMDSGDGLCCNARPASDNVSPLEGIEEFSHDVHAKVAEMWEIPSSIPHGDDNIVSGVGWRGLPGKEDSVASAAGVGWRGLPGKEDSVASAADLSGVANASMAASRLEDEISVGEVAQKMIAGEEQDDLPGLFPLRGDGLGISANLEVDCIDKNKDCSAGVDALLVSSRSPKELPIVAFDGDLAGQVGSSLSNMFMDVSEISMGNWIEGRCEFLAVTESDKVKSDICSGKVTCMDDRREEVNQLCSMQNLKELPVHYSRKKEEMRDRGGTSCLVILEERIDIPHFEHEANCLVQRAPSELIHCSALQGSLSENPSHPLAFAACCSKCSVEPDIKVGNFGTSAKLDGCSNGNGSRGEADRGSSTVDAFRRTNPKRGASLRSNLADEKFNQLFRTQSERRKCRKKSRSSSVSSKLTTKVFSEVKRKRRDSERQARLSHWGMLESLFHIIKQDCEFREHDSQVTPTVRKSKKAKSGVVRRKGVPALRNGLFHLSDSKTTSSSHCIMLDSEPFLENGVNHIMLTSDGHADSGNSNTVVQLEQNSAGQMCNALIRSTQRSMQHGDKDLESSLTEETSIDNLPSEYYGILSRGIIKPVQEIVDHKQLSDPDTSPDSLVYDPLMDVGVIASEDSVSTKGGCKMDQKILFQDPKTEDGLPSAAPTFIKTFAATSVSAKDTLACLNPNRSEDVLKDSKGKKGKKGKKENKRKEKKGKRNGLVSECPQTFSDNSVVAKLYSPDLIMGMKAASSSKYDLKEQHASIEGAKCSQSVRKHSEGGLKSERCSVDSSPGLPDLACFDHSMEVKKGVQTSKPPLQIVSKGQQSEAILSSGSVKGHQLSRSAKMELHKGMPSHGDSTWCRRKFNHGHHKRNRCRSDFESKKDIFLEENDDIVFTPRITNKPEGDEGEMGGKIDGSDTLFRDVSNNIARPVSSGVSAKELYHVLLDGSSISGKKAWALCDECQKWRCVPEELVHAIENTKWTCKDNVDVSFADCTIPQEKTNEVINKELEISDEEDCSTAQPGYWDTASQRKTSACRAEWTLIKSNTFVNRKSKTQTIDEIMVCYCKPPKDGGLGCHDECLNRMLNIECVKGTCPCGELCSNQQFQKRKYAKFKWIKCGKKGYGLQLEEDVSRGQFLIEYVGEVLDLAAYEARQRFYASKGHKHFYFMTLNGGEVIDACGKGNLGRFINHSCDPNCRTEKWMVNGEVCIGLFAIRDIKQGEEVTFDYNYVRVFGAAAKKCVCGAAECQGYIGGDPSKSQVIVQDDSAEEDIEPVMIVEDDEIELAVKGTNSYATETTVIKLEDASVERDSVHWNPLSDQGTSVQNEDAMHQSLSDPNQIDPLQQSSDCIESGHTMFREFSDLQESLEAKIVSSSTDPDDTFCASANDDQPLCTISRALITGQIPDSSRHSLDSEADHCIQESILDFSTKSSLQNSDSTLHKKKLITCPIEENVSMSKAFDLVKSSGPTNIKRSKANIDSMVSQKAKKVQNSMNNRPIDGVEEKLNELLDVDGGISRHKDSAKRYLKLLVVTAAAGDDIKGGLSQSARELSLILDAILKTKSRTVLVDIINKNGLQMLHYMTKQNRDNFSRIPILRKLLKVLEFLAEKRILTLEHINGAPPCNGMESFKESMLKLRKHRDSQVHTIARNFADHWIPCTARRFEPSDRDPRQLNSKCFHNSWAQASKFKPGHDHRKRENDATCLPTVPSVADINGEAYPLFNQVSNSASLAVRNLIGATRPGKRKSLWDQPSDVSTLGSQTSHSTGEPFSVFDDSMHKSGTVRAGNNCSKETPAADLMQQISDDDDMPPGFGFPCMDNQLQSSCLSKDVTREVVIAHTQEQYLPHLPVSFGMPIVLTQQLVTPEFEGTNQFDLWKIAPAMPFKPFPPLPLYPRTKQRNTGHTSSNGIITPSLVNNEWQ